MYLPVLLQKDDKTNEISFLWDNVTTTSLTMRAFVKNQYILIYKEIIYGLVF